MTEEKITEKLFEINSGIIKNFDYFLHTSYSFLPSNDLVKLRTQVIIEGGRVLLTDIDQNTVIYIILFAIEFLEKLIIFEGFQEFYTQFRDFILRTYNDCIEHYGAII